MLAESCNRSVARPSHAPATPGDMPDDLAARRGGLAPWQERRAKAMLLEADDAAVGLLELARACRLSRSHFARAFKATTGASPHRWRAARRLDRAKELLATTELPIRDVAKCCGFADQSHLTRAFAKAMHATPSHWRRTRGA